MGYLKRLFIFGLMLALCLMLIACSPSLLELGDGYEAHFKGHMVELDGEFASLLDIYPGENYLKLYDDGNGEIAFSGYAEPITWTKKDSTYTIIFEGEPCSATVESGIMHIEIDGAIVTYVAEGASAPTIPTTTPPDYNSDLTTAYGTYQGTEDLVEYYKGPCSISLEPDGMGSLILGGSVKTIAWEFEEDLLTIADENGMNSYGIISEGILVLDYMETGLQLTFAKEGALP